MSLKLNKKSCEDCGFVYSNNCPNKTHLGEKKDILGFYGIDPTTNVGQNSIIEDANGRKTTVKKYWKKYDEFHAY